jgi:hypothetical protein
VAPAVQEVGLQMCSGLLPCGCVLQAYRDQL